MTKIQDFIKTIPKKPGIYKMMNKDLEILYIGKAKDLRKRVQSYFQKRKETSPWKAKMIGLIDSIEFIETNSEIEALILETNLIKEIRPKYNILMKDDKHYVYIKIALEEDFPRIYTVRKRLKDKSLYIGPKTSGLNTKKTLSFLNKLFPYRMCDLDLTVLDESKSGNNDESAIKVVGTSRKTPCLDYHIKRCLGPCINAISKEEYQGLIQQCINFLQGKTKQIIKQLQSDMMDAATNRNFEKAAKLRDLLKSIEQTDQKQLASDTELIDRDVIGFKRIEHRVFTTLMQIREGKIIAQESFVLLNGEERENETLKHFLQNYYSSATSFPKEIIIPLEIEEEKLLEEWLKQASNRSVHIITPQKGKKNNLLNLAMKNAKAFASTHIAKFEQEKKTEENILSALKTLLKLKKSPKRIECYDISHLQGTETVGSMIVFENGKEKPSDYRKFKIQTLEKGEIDDYQSLREVLERRLLRLKEEDKNISIRTALKKDIEAIKKILKKEKLDGTEIKKSEFMILEKKKKMIGFGRVKVYEDKTRELTSLYIDKKERGNKYGWELMKTLLEKHRGKEVFVVTIEKLQSYYEEFGFKKTNIQIPECLIKKSKEVCEKKCKKKDIIFMKFRVPKTEDSFLKTPDLIIIDGGKGQLSSVEKILKKHKKKLPVISIAKKEEEIFVPGSKESIKLKENDPLLHLIQRIRDEAHRFAISFNKNLRRKTNVKSRLDEIQGIGPSLKKKLLKTFGSVQGIKEANINEIAPITGEKLANSLKENL